MNQANLSNTHILVLALLCLLLCTAGIFTVTATVGGTALVVQTEPRDLSEFLGDYLDLRTGYITSNTLDKAKEDLTAGILSSAEMGLLSQEYAQKDKVASVTVDSATLIPDDVPEGDFYTWLPTNTLTEGIAWFVADQKNRDQVRDFLTSGIIPETSGEERTIRSYATIVNNAVDLSKLTGSGVSYAGIGGNDLNSSDDIPYYVDPSFAYGSLDPSVALEDATKAGRDSEGYLNLLVIPLEKGDSAFYSNDNNENRMIFPKGMVWYATREVFTDSLSLDLPYAPAGGDNYSKVRLLYVEEMPKWYMQRIGLIAPDIKES